MSTTLPRLLPSASAADDTAAFIDAVIAYDRAETARTRENRWPGPIDERYIDTEYFVGTLRTGAPTLRVLFEDPYVGTYMRRMAYYILHTWRVVPAAARFSYDVFTVLYKYAPLRIDDIDVAAIRHWFVEMITDPVAESLARFNTHRTLLFPIRDVIREGFYYGNPPRAFSDWVWERRQQPTHPEDIYQAALSFTYREDLYLWEVLSHDTAVIRYMAEKRHAEPAVTAMRAHRARRARRRLRVAFRAVWGAVTAWRLYQRWALHPSRLAVALSGLRLATAATRAAFADADAPAVDDVATADRFSITAALREQEE